MQYFEQNLSSSYAQLRKLKERQNFLYRIDSRAVQYFFVCLIAKKEANHLSDFVCGHYLKPGVQKTENQIMFTLLCQDMFKIVSYVSKIYQYPICLLILNGMFEMSVKE